MSFKQWLSNNKFQCDCKKIHVCGKNSVWNPAPCNCEHVKYLASIRGDLMITCDEIIWWGDKNYSNKF